MPRQGRILRALRLKLLIRVFPRQEGLTLFAFFAYLLLSAQDSVQGQEPSADSLEFFESRVRPVLVEHCHSCHGSKKQWAGLRLDSREAILRGGDTGPAITANDPEKSLLIRAVRQTDPDLKMPENGKLSDQQIADLVRWVELGAPFPKSAGTATRNRDPNHWSFQPPVSHAVPSVNEHNWPESDIDQFILAPLESAGLKSAGRADKQTLLRRVTFDLTGLPPTPDDIEAFVTDERPDAFARLVDRLLSSPAYGERWGRRWLDVARYADSNGLDENIAHGNAWRYRDYVVASFNADKPFDQFITEQLAGDLLPASDEPTRHEQFIATGFISIGPKVLAEVNEAKMRMDIIDEQIDAVGRVFLGLTLGCARCHDHKFDPIDIGDYYGLAGVFKSTRTMDTYTKVAKWHENLLASDAARQMQAEYDARLAASKQAIEAFVTKADQTAREAIPTGTEPPEKLETLYSDATKAELAKLREELAAIEKNPPELPSAMGVTEDQVIDVAIHLRGDPQKLGDVVKRHTPPVLKGAKYPEFSGSQSGRRELAAWLVDPAHPLTARVIVNRMWRGHFGHGLVRTTENFGLLGEVPSHPELLDWLALRLINDGWSQKSIHRRILTSNTYQQSSLGTEATTAHDPENRLFGRASVRRLDAEEVRDALLSVGEQLDSQMGGSLLKVKNRGYLFDHTSIDLSDYSSRRRSIYLPVIRNNVYDLFQLLDFPDPAVPTGDRAFTTVAPQALLMMNSDFVMQSADELARRLLQQASDDAQRVSLMYRIACGREISASEREESLSFLADIRRSLASAESDPAQQAIKPWSILCHVTLASNEFIYIQ